jgi:hypothetical protein
MEKQKMDKLFVLGMENFVLKEYTSKKDADWNADEWVVVKAKDLETAKANYEKAHDEWQLNPEKEYYTGE